MALKLKSKKANKVKRIQFWLLSLIFLFVLSPFAQSKVKNVLFLISDDLKASVLGCYGNEVCKTSNIDKLADQSLVFERAYCQGTSCNPSRTSLMHSRYMGKSDMNLGKLFKDNSYYSARVGKIYHMRVPGDIIAGTDGLDIPSSWTERFNSKGLEAHTPGDYACLNLNIFTKKLEGRQSTRMPHRMFVTVSYDGDGSDQPDHKTSTKVISLLRKHKDEPFFLAAGFVRPHYPMVQPKKYFDEYPYEKMKLPPQFPNDLQDIPKQGLASTRSETNSIGKFPDNQKRMWSGYYASTQFMDEQVGRILDELERLGLRESTAVVFTSDHGYHLGEHTFWQKSNLHEEVLRVPLIISVPGMKSGRTRSMVELVDLMPTLAEICGLNVPPSCQGKSLLPILKEHSASVKEGALSFHKGAISYRVNGWSYTRYKGGSEEFYDMKEDPNQFFNLAFKEDNKYVSELKKMRSKFDKRLKNLGLKVGK
ncbi:MAG: iduronate-2-sulfatase [Verrucomicrobiales bacterium]|nr:iduronate-2-sulfatase [Verrucomicrobiales bacterium]